MQIKTDHKNFREILSLGEHVIPRYQRRYAWTEQNIRDYWTDLKRTDESHFLGSMVVCGGDNFSREVVDGQQRLTTTLIALVALRDKFEELGQDKLVEGIKGYIEYSDDDGIDKYRLTNRDESARRRLHSDVFLPREHRTSSAAAVEDALEVQALELFKSMIDEEILEDDDPVEKLRIIRNRILGSTAVYVNVDNRKNAFTIFETLNDRGRSLTVMDLVKNLVFSELPVNSAHESEDTWAEIVDETENLNFFRDDPFLYYFWNSSYRNMNGSLEPVEKTRIRREISDLLEGEADPIEARKRLLNEMHHSARVARALATVLETNGDAHAWKEIADRSWRRDKFDGVSRHTYGVLVAGSVNPLTLLLSLFSSYFQDRERISTQTLIEFVKTAECLQFRWSLAQKGSTSVIRGTYRRAAVAVAEARTVAQYKKALDDFKAQASRISPSDVSLRDGITRLSYSPSNSKDVFRMRYILSELERDMPSSDIDLSSQPSIEHIQGTAGRSELTNRNSWIYKIGNLTLLPPSVNSQLPEEFEDKTSELRKYVQPADQSLRTALESGIWGAEGAKARREWICEWAVTRW
ncbi:DUF262 domain-containing HNH endonuclease family protein [Micrococcus luteus]|uniref:GmrSD restriction endonuclease domain-containing protein n=1 Tax=Micrococcus luteus TaxID=1270 RepID=UPI0019CFBCB3|nr:DUF262 domain-containing protein [Micrococcus luteus]MBN6759490.1 DUF262 domain-containing protein [Micrococcus luteus]MBN6801147.1 DUF262 domain-containing protein [Micrococcus luteus]MCV7510614.1 DUF262 domain-containing HNH endonuclease family protein [Micrococcus luteus]MCV7519766.1 DUF262 domain-containing HNH endonuclease family protein [Micrococcus luteus]